MGVASHLWLPHEPGGVLRSFVGSWVGYESGGGLPGVHRGLPSAASTIVIAFGAPVRIGWHGSQARPRDFWMLAGGPHTRPVDVHHCGGHHGMQLSLTPGGCRAILGVEAAVLAHDLVELDALVALDHDALAAAAWDQRFPMVEAALVRAASRTPVRQAMAPELDHVWSLIKRTGGRVRVGDCASAVGWSRRRLRDRFTIEFGLTPKQAARLVRFQASRTMLESGQPLAGIAAECGYSDQPHLTREWRALTGYSPRRWVEAERRRPTAAG
jgi:AraC-like DNA-binding protein